MALQTVLRAAHRLWVGRLPCAALLREMPHDADIERLRKGSGEEVVKQRPSRPDERVDIVPRAGRLKWIPGDLSTRHRSSGR